MCLRDFFLWLVFGLIGMLLLLAGWWGVVIVGVHMVSQSANIFFFIPDWFDQILSSQRSGRWDFQGFRQNNIIIDVSDSVLYPKGSCRTWKTVNIN